MNLPTVAFAIVGIVLLLLMSSSVQAIPPGQENLIGAMLGADGGLPASCKLDDASVNGDAVNARFLCGTAGTAANIRLTPPGRGGLAARHTARFDLVADADVPADLLHALEGRVRAREGEWLWDVDGLPASHPIARAARGAQPPWPRGAAPSLIAVACAWLLTLGLLELSARRRAVVASPARTGIDCRFAIFVSGVFLISVGISLGRFRYVYDDYRFLYRAIESPWMWDEGLRFLTATCLYRLAHLVAPGAMWPFCAVNAAVMLVAVAFWVLALRGAGMDADEALLAGALFGMAPGGADLLRRASGIENLTAIALILGTLLVVQRAARRNGSSLDTVATVSLVLTLAATGTFVKFPYMAVLPPAVWIWARFVAPSSPAALRSVVFAAAIGAAAAIPWAGSRIAGISGLVTIPSASHVSLDALRMNLRAAGIAMAPWLLAVVWTVAFLAAWRLIRAAWTARRESSRLLPALRDEATRLARASLLTVRQPLGRAPLGLLAPGLSLLLLAPSLFNFDYFARYYVWPPAAPLAVLAARWLGNTADLRRAPLVVQVLAVALLLPHWDLRPPDPREPTERVRAFLGEVAALATTRPVPDRIVLVPACDSPDESVRAAEDLRMLYGAGGAHFGIRWATGLGPVDAAVVEPSAAAAPPIAGDLRLLYCPGQPLRLAVAPSGAALHLKITDRRRAARDMRPAPAPPWPGASCSGRTS